MSFKKPKLSGAYHDGPDRFYVISYHEHGDNRELVSKTFTTIKWAKKYISKHQHTFEGTLKIHSATLTGEL